MKTLFGIVMVMASITTSQSQQSSQPQPHAQIAGREYLVTTESPTSFGGNTRLFNPRSDSTSASSYYNIRTQGVTIVNEHLAYASHILEGEESIVKNEIINIEQKEVQALFKRDTMALVKLWDRDFTRNEPLNQLVHRKNPLPFYALYERVVEYISIEGDKAYSTGTESYQTLEMKFEKSDSIQRHFTHIWERRGLDWVLAEQLFY